MWRILSDFASALAGLTANRLVRTNASKQLESNAALTANRVVTADANGWPETPVSVSTAQAWSFTSTLTVVDGSLTIIGSADDTKTLKFEVDAQSTGCDLTINTGAQTADRTLSVPVLTGNATLAVLSEAQTFTGAKTFSAALAIEGSGPSVGAGRTVIDRGSTTESRFIGCGPDNATAGQISFYCASANASVFVDAFTLTSSLLLTNAATAFRCGSTTSATASNAGGFVVGNLVAATSVAIGGGNINAGGTLTIGGNFTIADGANVVLNTTTGTKIGTATTQKLGFWNATPVVQPATTGTTTGFTANAGTAMNSASTSTGGTGSAAYTFGDVVLALKQAGILAS